MRDVTDAGGDGRAPTRRGLPRLNPVAAGVLALVVLLAGTAAVVRWRSNEERAQQTDQLSALTSDTTTRITSSLLRYGDLLTSLAAFQRQGETSLHAYEDYVGSIGVQAYPGVTTSLFIERTLGQGEIAQLVDERRASGQPDFEVALTGAGAEHAVIAYAVPDPADVAGVDLAGDPRLWAALSEAAQSGLPVITSSDLVLRDWDLPPSARAVALQVYAPVYREGAPITSVQQRRRALAGWTGISVDVAEVLESLALENGLLDVAMFDGETNALLGESREGVADRMESTHLRQSAQVATGSRPFELQTTFAPGAAPASGAPVVGISGALAALAVAYGVYATMRFRRGLLDRAEGERQRAELMTSQFHAAVDGAPVGVTVVGLDGRVELVNARLRELMRVPDGDNRSITTHFRPEEQHELRESLTELLSGRQDHMVRDRQLVRGDGTLLWCRISSSVLRDARGQANGIVAHVQDIEAERAAVEELRSRSRWFSSIVERSSDLVTLFDSEGIVTWVSPSVGNLLGRRPDELLGASVMALVHREDRARVQDAIDQIRAGAPARVEYRVPGPTGAWIWLESTATDLLADPDVRAIIALSRDVTERHVSTQLLAHRASHDALTSLANRAELEHQLGLAIEDATSAGRPLAVAYLDLDRFKEVNDSYGHAAGDDLLVQVAGALREEVRDQDVIARMGGDEFVVVLPGADLADALGTAGRIKDRLSQPMAIDGVSDPVQVSASIGLAVATLGDTVTTLLRGADAALYEAKRLGRDRVEVSAGGLEKLGLAVDELI